MRERNASRRLLPIVVALLACAAAAALTGANSLTVLFLCGVQATLMGSFLFDRPQRYRVLAVNGRDPLRERLVATTLAWIGLALMVAWLAFATSRWLTLPFDPRWTVALAAAGFVIGVVGLWRRFALWQEVVAAEDLA